MINAKVVLKRLHYLLNEVCVDLGFCGGAYTVDQAWMLRNTPLTSRRFAEEVLRAEGYELTEGLPGDLPSPGPEIQRRFEKQFGECLDPPTTLRDEAFALYGEHREWQLRRAKRRIDV